MNIYILFRKQYIQQNINETNQPLQTYTNISKSEHIYIYIYVPYSILHTWMAMRPLRIIDTWMAMRPLRMIDLKYNFKMARWPLKCIGMPWQWYQWPWGLCCQHLLHGMQWSPTATFFLAMICCCSDGSLAHLLVPLPRTMANLTIVNHWVGNV